MRRSARRQARLAKWHDRDPSIDGTSFPQEISLVTAHHFVIRMPIAATSLRVLAVMRTLERHREFHPFIHELKVTATGRDDVGRETIEFRVVDLVPILGPWRQTVTYRSQLTVVDPERELRFHTEAPLGIRLESRLTAEPMAGGCILVEQVTLTGPPLLTAFSAWQARRSHALLFARLAQYLASATEAVS
jgi:hypothetical protein